MLDPTSTLTPEALEDLAAIALLERFVADSVAGRNLPLADYLAQHRRFEARIASALRLQREAEAIARLEHEGIARIYEHGRDATSAWIAMQYVAGGGVQQLLQRRRR